jgi:hypothetical protein
MTLKPSDTGIQAITDATERAEDLLMLWREQRRIAHRVHLARLRFELVDCMRTSEFAEIAAEVAEWKRLVRAFGESRRPA